MILLSTANPVCLRVAFKPSLLTVQYSTVQYGTVHDLHQPASVRSSLAVSLFIHPAVTVAI